MPKAAPAITNFNSGEFSPLLYGRVDIKYYPNACRRLRNFIPTRQGPVRRRPGTRHAAEVKTSANRTWLSRFEYNVTQSYILEWGDQYIRYYTNHGQIAGPYETATPYLLAHLTGADGTFQLRDVQSNDVQYIVHRLYAPRKLTRTGAATFALAALAQTGGPFKDLDPDNAITVYASANTGSGITLTASSAIFLAGHVGSLFLLEQKDVDSIKMWEPGKVIVANDVRRSDGKNYHALNGATTGTVKPVHSRGAKYDGDAGVQWQFDDPGYGWVKITAIGGGGTTATVDVLSRIPDNAVGAGNASTRWAHGAWSDVEGWPDHVTFWRERLTFMRGSKIWASVAADYENFRDRDESGLVTADMAITLDITSDRANDIQWGVPTDQSLLVGTAGDEHSISEITGTEALGPGNVQARKQSEHGSRHVDPVRVGDGVVSVQRAGRKMRDMAYSWEQEGYNSRDITVLAEHVTRTGIIDMAYQQEPDSVIWAVRADGQLLGMTLDREQDVKGWHPHRIGGHADAANTQFAVVEAVETIHSPDGDRDEVWMIVKRNINGSTKRYVEWMEAEHEEGDDPEDAFYVDSGLSLYNTKNQTLTPGAGATVKGTTGVVFTAGGAVFGAGDVGKKIHYSYYTIDAKGKVTWHKAVALITGFTSTTVVDATIRQPFPSLSVIAADGWRLTVTSVSGLGHNEGEIVDVWADGAAHPQRTVTAGVIALEEAASIVHVGHACHAVLQPMPLEAGAADGTARGKTARISRCSIGFHETAGAKYGRDEDKQMDIVQLRGGGDAMDERLPLFSGIKTVAWPDGYDGEALITIMQDQPGPCTVSFLVPHVTTQDDR